jgi:hypothetical protein
LRIFDFSNPMAMKKSQVILGMLLLFVVVFACRKKEPEPDPVAATRRVITGDFHENHGFHGLCVTHDGKIAIVAIKDSSHQLYVALLDGGLKTVWEHTYSEKIDNAGGIVETADGGLAIAVNRNVTGSGLPWNYCPGLIRLDANGNLLWEKTYICLSQYWQEYPLLVTDDGGFILAVTNPAIDDSMHFYPTLLKTGPGGDSLWSRTIAGHFNCYLSDLVTGTDQDYRMTGPCSTERTSPSGDVVWDIYPDMHCGSLTAMAGGAVAVAGSYLADSGRDVHLKVFDANGGIIWDKILAQGAWDLFIYGLCRTADGGFACMIKINGEVMLIRTDFLMVFVRIVVILL